MIRLVRFIKKRATQAGGSRLRQPRYYCDVIAWLPVASSCFRERRTFPLSSNSKCRHFRRQQIVPRQPELLRELF